jgi:purine-binding chemotaxis protein CheW
MSKARTVGSVAVDWQEIRDRLSRATTAFEVAQITSPERARQILDERARELARPSANMLAPTTSLSVLVFALGNEQYAIEARHVREVIRFTDFAPVPGVPDYVIGLANLRGEIITVFDLQRLFGLTSHGLSARLHMIVCGETQAEFGVVADAVEGVIEVSISEFVAEPAFVERNCLRGITRTALVVLDATALSHDRRLHIDQSPDTSTWNTKRSA